MKIVSELVIAQGEHSRTRYDFGGRISALTAHWPEPLPPELRSELLRLTAAELGAAEAGDGSIARAARVALAKVLKAERLTG